MKIPFNAIYYFEAVARAGSFKQASRDCFVTHAAVIQQVQKLESTLDVQLFYRHQKKLQLTPEGQALYQKISSPLLEITKAVDYLKQQKRVKIRIQSIPSLITRFLLPHIALFQAKYPEVDFELNPINSLQTDFDFLFQYSESTPKTNHQYLFSGESIVVCHAEHPAAKNCIQLNDIKNYNLIHDDNARYWREWIEMYAKEVCFDDVKTLATNQVGDFNLVKAAINNKLGIALCPLALVHEELESKKWCCLFPYLGNISRRYYLKQQQESPSKHHQLFENWCLEIASQFQNQYNEKVSKLKLCRYNS